MKMVFPRPARTTPSVLIFACSLCVAHFCDGSILANPPVASFIFPAGGQRGTTVPIRVGGLFLHKECHFDVSGLGVEPSKRLARTKTLWFEGPLLPLPDSQRQEDYPKDMAGQVRITGDASLGIRHGRLWTSEGAASGLKFVIGDLPEIVEQEIEGDPVAVSVKLPVTINGRIFPHDNIDAWSFVAKAGQTFTCAVNGSRIGSPLDPYLEVRDPSGNIIAESDASSAVGDTLLRFTAPVDGKYEVRIRDAAFHGGPAFVYRLTLTADPYLDHVYPLGGRRGSSTRFKLTGQALPKEAVQIALPSDAAEWAYRYAANGKFSNPVYLDLDDLPEHLETEPNDALAQAKLVPTPAMVNGRIDRPGDVDRWSFAMKKGETLQFDLRAKSLGSPLQGVVTVVDVSGKELGRAECNGLIDPTLSFTSSADGIHFVQVADRFKGRGGPAFAYRLRIAPPTKTKAFRLTLGADAVTVSRDGKGQLRVNAERLGGFHDAINLSFAGLPAGVKATNNVIPAGQNQVDVSFAAEKIAPIAAANLTVRGTARIDGRDVTQLAHFPVPRGASPIESVLCAVAMPCPFKVVAGYDMRWASRGAMHRRKYRLERNGFAGPVEITMADKQARHLQGVIGEPLVVPPGQSEFEYGVFLPPWMETGRTCRVCVQARGAVKENGIEHEVTFSATNQNDQIITVVETGRLEIATEKSSLVVKPGATLSLPVRVNRGKGTIGPVKVELILAEHIRGVSVEPLVIAAEQGTGTLRLRFATNLSPLNMPAVLRGTVTDATGPVVAEMKVELLEYN